MAASACAQQALPAPMASVSPSTATTFVDWARTHVHPAVVRIVAPGNGSISYGSGTLIYVGEQVGLVITNWHVINEATAPISVHFPDGFYSLGTIQSIDQDWDLAAIAIRKPPNVSPVSLSNRAPRPGEMLTIAGYGSGQYRAASGPCTQYVAPGLEFPYEMVELAASARQGDSGGPIFNDRGELAGVLFGEGNGRTSGSYCGRVRWFVSRVAPQIGSGDVLVARAPAKEGEPLRTLQAATQQQSSMPGAAETPPLVKLEPPAAPHTTAPPHAVPGTRSQTWQASVSAADPPPPPVASTRAEGAPPEVVQITWHDVAGETWTEQAKTILAGIGALAILLQALRWLSREEAAA
jgi:hypothetical protein